ncbi:Uncharacterised protein [Vibrio cholerae]|nr:Uncharacterised protein [Vibrio cholerae]CSI38544.1 Uncharacterised protein [Vibrio cholerae]
MTLQFASLKHVPLLLWSGFPSNASGYVGTRLSA